MNIVKKAERFAKTAHAGQTRKYTNKPYIVHPRAVVAILREHRFRDAATLAAAWLHDVIEDCNVSRDEIEADFGEPIATTVQWLTNAEIGNRERRKRMECERLARAPSRVQNIKLADVIDNTGSIVKYDPEFAAVYMREKRDLVAVLTKADSALRRRAQAQIDEYFDCPAVARSPGNLHPDL